MRRVLDVSVTKALVHSIHSIIIISTCNFGRRQFMTAAFIGIIAILALSLVMWVLTTIYKKKNNVEVVILTSDKSNIENLDVKKFNKE